MKKLIYILHAAAFVLLAVSCEQELVENTASPCPSDDPSIICPEAVPPACPPGASAGSADFSKFVALGTSYTAGFQAGALFNEGQNNSLGKILATQFECVGGGAFNQPSIKSENGFNIFITPNPAGNTVLGRFKLQGTPPQPAPVVSALDAVPNPQLNPGFMYTGSPGSVPVNQLNNFAVPAMFIEQSLIYETGDWALAGMHPYFHPFYARFSSAPGDTSLVEDAIASIDNNGTFVMIWLGMDDAYLHAAYGGDAARAPLTSESAFKAAYSFIANSIFLGYMDVKGVLVNIPDPFVMPHFTSVPWNAIPLDAATAGALTTNLANNYNAFLNAMVAMEVITAEEAAMRQLSYTAGQNPILMKDEKLTDLTPYMAGPYEGLRPYALARQTNNTDIIPLSAGTVLGTEIGPNQVLGVSVPVDDQYVLAEHEWTVIVERIGKFNEHIKTVSETGGFGGRVALADVNTAMKNFVTAKAAIADGLTITPNINPPTGMYSEDGLHPNSRGYAFIANIIIDAINAKFSASVPKTNLGKYSATGLPINP